MVVSCPGSPMANRVYALLVGINDYEPPIESLDGCLNDVDLLHEYLDHHVDRAVKGAEFASAREFHQLVPGERGARMLHQHF